MTRTGGSDGAVSVAYATADSSAIAGSDYTATSGTLNWAGGDAADKTITINITDDSIFEGDEAFTLALSSASGGASLGSNTATINILENDVAQPGTLSFTTSTTSVVENNTTITLTVARSNGSDGTVSAVFASVDGSAIAGEDYMLASGTLNWADGDAADKTISITIVDDIDVENDETFSVGLSGANGGASLAVADATITITDNDVAAPTPVPGSIGLSSSNYSVNENETTATITINRTNGSDGAIAVDYAISAGTATLDSDFTDTFGTLSWADGDSSAKTFSIIILDDQTSENDETINISLKNVIGGASLVTSDATLTIVDDDTAPIAVNQPPAAPILISPADGSTGVDPTLVTFDWNMVSDPDGDAVDYLLEYCVNANFTNCTIVQKPTLSKADTTTIFAGIGGTAGMSLALLGLVGGTSRRQRLIQAAILVVFALSMSACGTNIPLPNGDGTMSQTATNLQANTTYYWKVTATDTNGLSATSEVWSFTTL